MCPANSVIVSIVTESVWSTVKVTNQTSDFQFLVTICLLSNDEFVCTVFLVLEGNTN